jgi:hypothetical protein
MANDVTTKAAALPAALVAKIAAGIGKSQIGAGAGGGGQILLRLVTGKWLFGQGNDEVQHGSSWLVNITTFKHGDVTWFESQLVDEYMVDMWSDTRPLPPTHATGASPKQQMSVEMKCMNGEDAGLQVLYKISSLGGTAALFDLKEAVRRRVDERGPEYPYLFPVLELGFTSYPNKRYGGTTYNPVLKRVGWADINGQLEGAEDGGAPAAALKEPEPAKPSKPSLKAVPDAEPQQAATGQRRRPR